MIQEFIKEYRKLKWQYENKVDDSFWFLRELDNLVDRYETELNIQSLKEMQTKPFDPAVNDSIKDMEEEERAFPSDKE